MNNTMIHHANTRGLADFGWLLSRHTFSFGQYHNPERMNFGALRVLNDDIVAPAKGFGTHPHRNMEIITIPLEGDLEHRDSMGNLSVIKNGDIQVMSAGRGITHSEYNKNEDRDVHFLQIWITPNQLNVHPRYAQKTLNLQDRQNHLQQIISPNPNAECLWIHQDAWLYLGMFNQGVTTEYRLQKNNNGLYVFIINGEWLIHEQKLQSRDGMGIVNENKIRITSTSLQGTILLMEVPMEDVA